MIVGSLANTKKLVSSLGKKGSYGLSFRELSV